MPLVWKKSASRVIKYAKYVLFCKKYFQSVILNLNNFGVDELQIYRT